MSHAGNDRVGSRLRACGWLAAVMLLSTLGLPVQAQEPVFNAPPGASPDQMRAMMRARRGGPPPQAAGEQPKPDEKKPGEEKKEDNKDKKKEEDNSSIKRPEKPPRVPDPREFEVKLDKSGRVPAFNFIGQTWPDVLQWLANISNCSLDWQELPNDYLNLTTQKSYPLDEVRNLVNRHLHARGYTLLMSDGVLSVFKVERLDPSLVPRIDEESLYDRKPYDFVKVSFELPEGMDIEKAKEDVKQVLSPQAKVFPLVTTRRLLVIDAVANQRLVSALLNEERAFVDGQDKPRVFPLRYARAEKVVEAIYVLFGMDPQSRPSQMDLQIQQQKLQLMQQIQQQGKDISRMLQPDGPKIYLAVNRQTNSILANAPPEDMRTIERAIKALDVPATGSPAALAAANFAEPYNAAAGDALRLEKYPLVTMDPAALQLTLEEIGSLDPRTQLQVDKKSKTLFARATDDDHKKILAMRDELDGTGRQLKVIWLPRRLPADAVAGSILGLMSGQEEEEEEERQPFWFYSYRNRDDDDDKPKKGFRVDADIENNRLLLWANEAELAQVEKFLAELTADAPNTNGPRPVRVLDAVGAEETKRLIEALRQSWPALGENELIIDDKRPAKPAPAPAAKEAAEEPATEHSAAVEHREPAHVLAPTIMRTRFAQLQLAAAEEPVDDAQASAPVKEHKPPVTVTITPDGRLVIASQDSDALDLLEDLVDEIAPPANRFKMFRLNYAKAVDVYYNLKEYFEDELSGERGQMLDWWGNVQETGPKEKGIQLSKRRTLRLIWDPPSNSILVANASPSQLYEIEQLIKEYDLPASADSTSTRSTGVIKIRYSRASKIAAAVKDVYRDLLSSKDKEFDKGERKEQGSSRESVTVIRYNSGGSGGGDGDAKKTAPLKVGFEGALSIGADDVSNVLLVSAQEEIFDGVVQMIHRLDEEARPRTTVQVHRVKGNIDAAKLQKALSGALGTPWLGNRPETPEAQAPAADKPKPDGNDGGNDRESGGNNNGGD